MSDESRQVFELDEPGFRGEVSVEGPAATRTVRVLGVRPEGHEWSAVEKVLDAHRDPGLSALADRCAAGDRDAAVGVLSHVGLLDPG